MDYAVYLYMSRDGIEGSCYRISDNDEEGYTIKLDSSYCR